MSETSAGFRERARFEAARYGSDPWVFVRELLQNARDAGATEVRFRVTVAGGRERLSCRDDGDGMTAEHARRYLFRLYASSKASDPGAAGRFGIGFWSVLRFGPDVISVRSRPRGGDGWEVQLDGDLEHATERPLVMQPGTEVVCERPALDGDTVARVIAAVAADARLLRRRDDASLPVDIFVNDERVEAATEPPRPHVRFEGAGVRGVVALADRPLVEVFARGLRVRTASFLDELLLADAAAPVPSLELPEGLLPHVVIDSDRLRVLMARGDARDDAALRLAVRMAGRELDRLIRCELDHASPVGPLTRLAERLRGALRRHRRLAVGAAIVAAVLVAAAVAPSILPWRPPPAAPAPAPPPTAAPTAPAVVPFRDLAGRYDGPAVDPLAAGARLDLRYRPASAAPLLGALRLHGLAPDGSVPEDAALGVRPAPPGTACDDGCLEVEVSIAAAGGLLRLPVAAGHRVEPGTVRLDGRQLELLETAHGEPAVRLDSATAGLLSYRSGPASALVAAPSPQWPELPGPLAEVLPTLELLPPAERLAAAEQVVRAVVAYDREALSGRRLQEARRGGRPLFEAAVELGRGDCDVQNALLAALLTAAGQPAVLVVGYAGVDGRVLPGVHAWVEVEVEGEPVVADASLVPEVAQPAGRATTPPVEPTRAGARVPPVHAPVEARPAPPAWRRPAAVAAAVIAAAGLAACLAVWLVRRRREPARTVESDGGVDLGRLLSGALVRPEAYRHAPALFDRPLVPLIGERGLSLRRAVAAARRGRLFRSDGGSPLARRAAGRGDLVVDGSVPAGAAVADLLGARDLDAWSGVAERAVSGAAATRGEEALRRLGSRWRLIVAEAVPGPLTVVDGRMLGLAGRTRVLVVDRWSELWQAVDAAAGSRPAWSALVLADGAADALALVPRRRLRWLAGLARAAVDESGGAAP